MGKILLTNGEIVSGKGIFRKDVLINEGKIENVDGKIVVGKNEKVEIIDCRGKLIFPGLIDVHVHFREPGAAYKEDFMTGSQAAASSGVTTVCDMPNNKPPILTVSDLEKKRELIKRRSYVNYGFYIGYDGKNIEEINRAENIAGVKVYTANSTGNMGVGNNSLEDLFKKTEQRIVIHAEDEDLISENATGILKKYKGKEEGIPPMVHSQIRSPEAAISSVKYLCELAKKLKRKIHIAHISTEGELQIISKFKKYVTCEVAPHHLLLSDDDYELLGNLIKINPPVRSRSDLFALWKALKQRGIDMIATDHAPHTIEEKTGSYLSVPSGVPELDTLASWLLNSVNDEGLTAEEVVRLCCEKPAEIFGMKNKGQIKKGFDADLFVADMNLKKKIVNEKLFTKCGWSPYSGLNFTGCTIMTFVNGKMVYEDGKIIGKAMGVEIKFNN